MQTPLQTLLLTLLASLPVLVSVHAAAETLAEPGTSHFAKGLAKRFIGEDVDSIRGVETLSHWITLDTQRLTLRVNQAEQYLLTLDAHCDHLRGAQLVGISMTNHEIWADFDHVSADGHECRINRITRLKGHKKLS